MDRIYFISMISHQEHKWIIAATADLHIGINSFTTKQLEETIESAAENANILLIGGDITEDGTPDQARKAAEIFRRTAQKKIAVYGDHDQRHNAETFRKILEEEGGVTMLQGQIYKLPHLVISGVMRHTNGTAPIYPPGNEPCPYLRLGSGISTHNTSPILVLTHLPPIKATKRDERGAPPKYNKTSTEEFIDNHPSVITVFHGHSHNGTHIGKTAGGKTVINVASYVLQREQSNGRLTPESLYKQYHIPI